MTGRRRLVRVPASSANLGPGYDVMAAAVSLKMEVEVSEEGEFSVDAGEAGLPDDETNLCVSAFADLHPVDGVAFRIRSEIPLAAGLGSLGEHFPDTDPDGKGADSAAFVTRARELASEHGFVVGNLDVVVIAQAPRLAPHAPEIRRRLTIDVDPLSVL